MAAGLNQVNLSLDTLQEGKFMLLTRRQGLSHVLDSLKASIEAQERGDLSRVKLNVVVMRGVNEDEVISFIEMTRFMPIYIRFIEYMPFSGNCFLLN